MSVAGLILSAGESSRMGSPKALLQLGGETFLDHLTALFADRCDPVIVVLGHNAQAIRSGIEHPEQASFVENTAYQDGQLSSMRCGLQAVPSSAEGVLFTLVDHPSIRSESIDAVLRHRRSLIAIPVFGGRRGHPIYLRRDLLQEFFDPDIQSAKDVVRRHRGETVFVDVNDPGILDDIDDPAAYRRLVKALP